MIVGEFSDLLPLLLFYVYSEFRKAYPWLTRYLLFSQILYIFSFPIALAGVNNMWVYQLVGLLELVLLYSHFSRYKLLVHLKIAFWLVLGGYLFLTASVGPYVINSLARAQSILFLIILCFQFFYKLYRTDASLNLLRTYDFWLTSAFLLYLSLSFFAFLFSYQSLVIAKDFSDFVRLGWLFHSLGNFVKGVMLVAGIYVCRKTIPAKA